MRSRSRCSDIPLYSHSFHAVRACLPYEVPVGTNLGRYLGALCRQCRQYRGQSGCSRWTEKRHQFIMSYAEWDIKESRPMLQLEDRRLVRAMREIVKLTKCHALIYLEVASLRRAGFYWISSGLSPSSVINRGKRVVLTIPHPLPSLCKHQDRSQK